MNMENLFCLRKLTMIPAIFLMTVFQTFFCTDATAQVKSMRMFLSPETIDAEDERRKLLLNASPILKLIDRASRESPLAFAWQLNRDTLLNAKDVFREVIEFQGDATFRKAIALDTITLKKNTEADYDVRRNFLSHSIAMATYEISQQKGKQILVFANSTSKEKLYFKVFLDKASKRILKIQNLSNGRFYLPVPFEGGTISM